MIPIWVDPTTASAFRPPCFSDPIAPAVQSSIQSAILPGLGGCPISERQDLGVTSVTCQQMTNPDQYLQRWQFRFNDWLLYHRVNAKACKMYLLSNQNPHKLADMIPIISPLAIFNSTINADEIRAKRKNLHQPVHGIRSPMGTRRLRWIYGQHPSRRQAAPNWVNFPFHVAGISLVANKTDKLYREPKNKTSLAKGARFATSLENIKKLNPILLYQNSCQVFIHGSKRPGGGIHSWRVGWLTHFLTSTIFLITCSSDKIKNNFPPTF